MYFTIQLALKHSGAGLYAITNSVDYQDYAFSRGERDFKIAFNVIHISNDIRVRYIDTNISLRNFKAVDATPMYNETEDQSMRDFVPFRELDSNQKTEDIIIDPEDVSFWMNKILEAQKPKQKEIREKMLRERRLENLKPVHDVHAKIISLAS
jgi:hypothetical protein